MTTVRKARAEDRDQIVALIDIAFFDLAANQYLVPEHRRRSEVMRGFFGLHVDHGLTSGLVTQVATDDTGSQVVGAALWYRSDDPGPEGYAARMASAVGSDRLDRFSLFEQLLHKETPDAEHAYLGFLAVMPGQQGRGIGGRLLREQHRRLDERNQPAYLVASNDNSARLYRAHGYRPLPDGRHALTLPNDGVMTRMWREPRTS